jgi:hypothetical protein
MLLAVSGLQAPLVRYERIRELLTTAAVNQSYASGVVHSTHHPQFMEDTNIGGDTFKHEYVLETPIDGFGRPLIYLSMLRKVCSNGAIGYSRAFRSEIALGKNDTDVYFTIQRALDSYSNDEGFAALRQRFESAAQSWASVGECQRSYRVLAKLISGHCLHQSTAHQSSVVLLAGPKPAALETDDFEMQVVRAWTALTGDICALYGLAHLDALTQKKMAQLPAKCTVYSLINFLSELATHHLEQRNGRLLQAEIGMLLSTDYDLEGSVSRYPDFQDWFLDKSGKEQSEE